MEPCEPEHRRHKALANPIRYEMTRHLDTPRSVKQVACIMRVARQRLYHHMNVLEECGVVKLAYRKQRGGAFEEKFFRLTGPFLGSTPPLSDEVECNGELMREMECLIDNYRLAIDEGKDVTGYICINRFTVSCKDVPRLIVLIGEGLKQICVENITPSEEDEPDATLICGLLCYQEDTC